LKSHRVPPNRILVEVNEAILGRNENTGFRAAGDHPQLRHQHRHGLLRSRSDQPGLLSRYSFDKIKVDRSFLLHDEQKSGRVLAAITSLGRSLGFRVSGQGVETIEHAQMLRAAGCSEAQGYYFGPPMPLEQVLRVEQEFNTVPLAAIA
jgi:predicted signal transduction protein with EAL and GGDEF domain